MALHRPQPALLGNHDSDRLALNHCLMSFFKVPVRCEAKTGSTLAECCFRAKLILKGLDFGADLFPLTCARCKQAFKLAPLGRYCVEFRAACNLLELEQ